VGEALLHVIESTERNMMKTSGENKRFEDIPLPPIILTTRVLRDPHTGNNKDKLELKRNMQHLKNAFHLEMSTEDTKRINPVLTKANASGILKRAFGPYATLLWTNNNFQQKGVKELQEELKLIKIQASLNLGHSTVTLNGLTVISMPFKVALVDGTKPKKSTMTLAKVMMSITAPDTEENLTRHPVFEQVFVVSKGPEKGMSRATYFDDAKSRTFRGKQRTKDGPNTGLVRNMAEYPVDYLFCFMHYELGFTKGTCYSALQGCNQELVASVDLAEWNSETFRVSSPLHGESTVQSHIARSMERFHELGMEDFDFSGLTESKQEVDDEDAEKEKLMRDHKLYPDLNNLPKVGASGATARTDASAVSSVAQSAKSTNSVNIEGAYRKAKMKLANKTVEAANQKSELAQQKRQVEEEKARVASLLKMMQDAGIDPSAVMAGAAAVGDTQKNPPKKKKIAFAGEDEDEHFSETLGAKQAEEAVEIGSSSTSSIGSDVDMDCDEQGPGSDESDDESSGDQSGVPPSGGSQTGGPQD
jgi:DNA-binding protein H-NS